MFAMCNVDSLNDCYFYISVRATIQIMEIDPAYEKHVNKMVVMASQLRKNFLKWQTSF